MSLVATGIPSREQIDSIYPSAEVRAKGPVAVFECFQKIPCDPCYWSCPQKAVSKFDDINDIPVVDSSLCTGCGICVAKCPGLAVFVIQDNYDASRGLVKMPHEFLPLPAQGDTVTVADRAGNALGQGEVIRVVGKKKGETPVVWVAVDRALVRDARALMVGGDCK